MGNTLGGPTGPGGMMKTMKDMMSLTTGGGSDRESSIAAEKLPDGEKYFGFVNVVKLKIIITK
jgi:ubiquitin C-terminal hydrolase